MSALLERTWLEFNKWIPRSRTVLATTKQESLPKKEISFYFQTLTQNTEADICRFLLLLPFWPTRREKNPKKVHRLNVTNLVVVVGDEEVNR